MSYLNVGDFVVKVRGSDGKIHVVTNASRHSVRVYIDGFDYALFEKDLVVQDDTWLTGRYLYTEMPDGSTWRVPVGVIAVDRARHYKQEFGDSLVRSLLEGTIPLFEEDDYEVRDWASGSMDWADVEEYAVKAMSKESPVDYQEGWVNGKKRVCLCRVT